MEKLSFRFNIRPMEYHRETVLRMEFPMIPGKGTA